MFDELEKFFGTLKKFNYNEFMDHDLHVQIERYFIYRWFNYKNVSLKEKFGSDLFDQMPDSV